ncbi:MAG: bifunctional histidinol-phosphatase/imidazoleglycerol-phosphate dehydratase HisB [Prevotellaceae bacterium]|nr:bifunctional histidinol-phosphatase/imidazoleglycerol-phosphate dehydratase HisB [Prevotellaceae bacterium]
MRKILFIDRDGTILQEPEDEQIDAYEKFHFVPGCITALSFIRRHTDYLLVMVSNQDGLGTSLYPEENFWPTHNLMLETLRGEGVEFDAIHIDRSLPAEGAPTRKPRTGMLERYLNSEEYDLRGSYVIGDRESDRQLAAGLGCQFLLPDWAHVREVVCSTGARKAEVRRATRETDISLSLNLDGEGKADIATGLGFLDHMLEQIARHGNIDLSLHCKGDLNVDEHHTMEDTALVLGEGLLKALGDKRGIERYGYTLPMDDCLCQVALDFGGRAWLVWDVEFTREMVGDVPTEMFRHFFKSLSESAHMNLHISARGENNHHKIEGVFKALARALKMAVRRDPDHLLTLPSSKGTL